MLGMECVGDGVCWGWVVLWLNEMLRKAINNTKKYNFGRDNKYKNRV